MTDSLPGPSRGPLGGQPAGAVEVLERELDRVLVRLTALGPLRAVRPGADGSTPLDRVRPLLQELADMAADATGRARRSVPHLADHAVGDQLTVLVRDLVEESDGSAALLADLTDRLVDLRRRL